MLASTMAWSLSAGNGIDHCGNYSWGISVFSAAHLARPGPVTGLYPEHREEPPTPLDQAARQLGGSVRQAFGSYAFSYWGAVRRIEARGEELSKVSDSELRTAVDDLRRNLVSRGFRRELGIEAFALVREQADRTLGMRHFPVQLIGGWVLLQGRVAEMQTGEGKSLTATLAAATAALAGVPVHVITVNDYLVQRDAELMGPLFRALGLRVSAVNAEMQPQAKREAYRADITYCTNKQLVFDYLRDRLALGSSPGWLRVGLESLSLEQPRGEQVLLRGLCFGIVDEADSVLIDEARTPLIISSGSECAPSAERTYREALEFARVLNAGEDYLMRVKEREIELTESGEARLERFGNSAGGLWRGKHRREDLMHQALNALHFFHRDRDYLVRDDKVHIIDEFTGRLMSDRSWERGLHQLIEAKEGCQLTGQHLTRAKISYQRFFRRYLHLCGMTGTASDVRGELWSVYGLNVVKVPTNKPLRRRALSERMFRSSDARWLAIVSRVQQMRDEGRSVLVGTRSVEGSERLSQLLTESGIQHQVLNARQDRGEADIVAGAGGARRVTVATNMAGRGTDIKLDATVAMAGGLHVIASERHEARRIDRQLFGRCGRQGDPGSFEAILSLEDELLISFSPVHWRRLAGMISPRQGPLPGWAGKMLSYCAQTRAEGHHSKLRRRLLKLDDQLGDLLAFSGKAE